VCCSKLRRIQGTFLILTDKYLPQGLLGYITLGERCCVRVTVFAIPKYCSGMVFYAPCVFPYTCLLFHSRISTPSLNMDVFTTVPPYSILIEDPKELTPSNRFLLEKLRVPQLVNKFPVFHGTRSFRTLLFKRRHLSLSWADYTPPISCQFWEWIAPSWLKHEPFYQLYLSQGRVDEAWWLCKQ